MLHVIRNFDLPERDIGEIKVCLLENKNMIGVSVLNLHGMGQAYMRVRYSQLDLYDIINIILNKLTDDYTIKKDQNLYTDMIYSENDSIPFTRENINLLERINDDSMDDNDAIIICGNVFSDGTFIYNGSLVSNDEIEEYKNRSIFIVCDRENNIIGSYYTIQQSINAINDTDLFEWYILESKIGSNRRDIVLRS